MTKILVARPMKAEEVVKLLTAEPKSAHVLTEDIVNSIANAMEKFGIHLVFEPTKIGYVLLKIYNSKGETLYEIPNTPQEYDDVLFWGLL